MIEVESFKCHQVCDITSYKAKETEHIMPMLTDYSRIAYTSKKNDSAAA